MILTKGIERDNMKTILMTDRPPLLIDEEEWEQIGIFQMSNPTGVNCLETITLFVDVSNLVDNTVIVHGTKITKDANYKILHSISCGYIVAYDEIAATARKMCNYMGFHSHYVDALVQSLPAEEFESPRPIDDIDCLVVDFDGSLKINPNKLMFVKVDSNPNPTRISGKQWLELTEAQKEEFTVEDLGQALKDSVQHNYERIRVIVLKEILTKGK
jgi:hypothetical protein